MLSDGIIYTGSGAITSGIENEHSLKAVITFIKEHFRTFAEDNKGSLDMNEKGLSQKLCIALNRKAKKHPFFFHSEYMENVDSGNSPQVDIGTLSEEEKIVISDREYNEDDSFFSIEAKRLPTPGKNREKEYVVGLDSPSGAMERFKKGIHGPHLKYAAIIAYVQNETFEHWFLKINSWIEELASDMLQTLWTNKDKIEKADETDKLIIHLLSENSRIIDGVNLDDIKLFHFWVNLLPDS